jgi:hypothetical protein
MLPNPFLGKITFTVEKSSPIIGSISAIFTKLPKLNSLPIFENSPNLVTPLRKFVVKCVFHIPSFASEVWL